ncbi:MAG: TRAP transporter small permease [Actinomycetota bacterium]
MVLAASAIVAMALIMLAESIMRYAFSAPLGWNVSAVERILMPMSVFLALPWLYVTAGHVSAEIIYDRFSARWRMAARVIGHVLLLVIAASLAYSGMVTVADSFVLGDAPPPGSSEVPLPSWIWQLSQPVGTAALFVVALLDTPRAIGEDQALAEETDSEESVLASAESDSAGRGPSHDPITTDRDGSSGTAGGDRR